MPEPEKGAQLFQLLVATMPAGHFRVDSFAGNEELSGLYQLDVVVTAPDLGHEVIAERVVGRRATFVMQVGSVARTFCGMVAAVRVVGARPLQHRVQYSIRVAPRLWRLRFKRRSRIFQNLSIDAIISSVLTEENIDSRWELKDTYPTREYCTQYEETDYQFIRRLIAEAAILFRYEQRVDDVLSAVAQLDTNDASRQPAEAIFDGETLVFGDDMATYQAIDTEVHYADDAGTMGPTYDKVARFETVDQVQTNAAAYWEYDPERPQAILTASSAISDEAAPLEHYGHHGTYEFVKWDYSENEPDRILRQRRRRAAVAYGEGSVPALAVGGCFRLEGHALQELNRDYAVTGVKHEGWATMTETRREVYRNRFECVPADVLYCLPRPPRRNAMVTVTATVVGPGGAEIHTDERGRIKVQFHWDRDGTRDDGSSCWIRTMQAWGGQGWGSQLIPRVGMEVVVTFEGGDPDRPLVLGCMYNGTHPLPFQLPEEKTRSGIRTQSTPQAEGFNELSFEDKVDHEQIYLHAQRDLVEKVGNDHTTTIDHNEVLTVSGDQSSRVLGARHHETVGAVLTKTAGDHEEHAGGSHRTLVGNSKRVIVQGDEVVRVIGKALRSVKGDSNLRVDGNLGIEIGTVDDPRNSDSFSWGHNMVGAGRGLFLRGDERVVLECGESSMTLFPDHIELRAPKIKVAASEEVSLTGDGPALRLDANAQLTADAMKFYSKKASLELDDDAHVNGTNVKINCGMGDPDELLDEEREVLLQPLKLIMTDPQFKPYANKPFIVKAGGKRAEGTTDGDGKLDVEIPAEARAAEVTLWLGERPSSETRRYVIELAELAEVTSIEGVQTRLRHLGFFFRTPTGELDAPTRHALEEFQEAQQLEVSGEPDDATRAKLLEVHGS